MKETLKFNEKKKLGIKFKKFTHHKDTIISFYRLIWKSSI